MTSGSHRCTRPAAFFECQLPSLHLRLGDAHHQPQQGKKAGKVSTGPEEVAKKPPMMIAAALQNLECQVKIILEQTQQLQAELEALKSSSSDAQLQADKVADLQVRVTWLERMVAREFQ
ncbi:unnamed protein product [Effrenium voratum]|nr:unnamed protein product [Effrenium voratum]